ncbi:MAG: DUF2752 domain-containing protein [Clostridia bacterium]|nr:DUF2752 domain-containing protein [Clostridia bacterium]
MKKAKKLIIVHAGVVLVFVAYYALLYLLDATCLIREITSHPCPTCGMTRAFLSLLRFDLEGYFYYNPATIACVVAILLGAHKKLISGRVSSRVVDYSIIALTLGILTVYIVRLMASGLPQ